MTSPMDMQTYLNGAWTLSRRIWDYQAAAEGTLDGTTVFARDNAGLRYAERGRLRLGGGEIEARRVYLWRFPAVERVEMFFEDGRFFHAFDPNAPAPTAGHLCGEDFYEVRYAFAAREWRATWRVRGPRKDYRMRSVYRR